MSPSVHVALISGPPYDPLYDRLDAFTATTGIDVQIGFTGDHSSLNRHLAECEPVPYDLVSTHSKYAPSQRDFLAPLDGVLDAEVLDDFAPQSLDLARIDGALYGLPRVVDVRLLHYRTDLMEAPPATWDELVRTARAVKEEHGVFGFAFPGRDSGLFGTFYELAEMGGAALFPQDLVPDLDNEGGAWALRLLRTLYADALVPPDLPDWHFDAVHRAFREGRVAMIGDWPGFYGLHADPEASHVAERFSVCPYPSGPNGTSRAYGGEHTFALTPRGTEKPEAAELLTFLTAPAQQRLEAQNGAVPPRRSVLDGIQSEAAGRAQKRWGALERVLQEQILIPPKLPYYPRMETVIWTTVQQCFTWQRSVPEALAHISQQIESIVETHTSDSTTF
jgi:multiple sugar transport system substrate-binding protein